MIKIVLICFALCRAEMIFRHGSANIPQKDKRHKGGEDAYLASNDLVVVADGVSMWETEFGIDSGRFSKQLVTDIKYLFEQNPTKKMKQIIKEAVEGSEEIGTTTVMAAKLVDN